jgi:maltooligosyltrehalose trehalohydrolase
MARCLTEGFAYQGEPSAHAEGEPRGTPSAHLPPTAFVICLQNHDQIGNRAMGDRLTTLANPQALRAAIALLLLTPQIPLIFMGEEWGAEEPFLFFTDHNAELGKLVTEGRRKEFAHFAAFTHKETREKIPDPNAPATFAASIVSPTEQNTWTDLYKTCLDLRRTHITPFIPGCTAIAAQAISDKAVRATWRLSNGAILTLATNFGADTVPCEPGAGTQFFGPAECLPGFSTSAWITS